MTQNWMLDGWRPFVAALLAASLVGFSGYASAGPAATPARTDAELHAIDIPPGDLVESLEHLAKQFGLELVYDADQLKGITTPGVSGRMTVMEAVHQLLKGKSLRLIEHPDGAILVMPQPAGDPTTVKDRSTVDDGSTEADPKTAGSSPVVPQTSDPQAQHDTVLRAIVVTGTHIRGESPVGSSMVVHTREEMQESGSATLEQFGRKMTENYAGTDAVATVNTNAGLGSFEQGAASNIFGGAGFNLKGLGPGSTLTLLNGHRLAAGGLDGSIVDISQIPLSAVDHIEVLDDGASAIYGSDAVAGVVNIITRREFEGAETALRYGRATQGGAVESTASQLAGTSWNTGNVLFDYEYDDQGGLDASQRNWIGPLGGPYSLIPENRRNSVYVTGREDISDDSSLSTDLLYSDRHFESQGLQNATNSLLSGLQSSAGSATQSAASVTFDQHLRGDWSVSITGNYSSIRQRDDTLTLGSDGAAGETPTSEHLDANSDIRGIDVLLNGSVPNLGGGAVKESWGGSFRSEGFRSGVSQGGDASAISQRRDVVSGYAEFIAPIVADGPRWLRRLEVSAAFRYDHYEGFGNTKNPKFGWLWEPMTGLRLKGTVGTSFKAPLLSQLGAPITSYTALFPSGGTQSGKTDVLIINGGNPGVHPENATSITLGLDYTPTELKGLKLSVNAFGLRFDNRIQAQTIQAQPILSQSQLQFITFKNPPPEYVQTFFSSPGFQGDNAGLGPSGVSLVVDDQLANTASTRELGLNASGRFDWSTHEGDFSVWLGGQYLVDDRIRTAFYEPQLTVDNTLGEPPKFKARGGLNWTIGPMALDLTLNYVNAYQNTLFIPSQEISSWTTGDLYLGYMTGADKGRPWADWQFGLSVQNLLDQKPPYLQIPAAELPPGRNGIPFDGTNASPVGRLIAIQFKKMW